MRSRTRAGPAPSPGTRPRGVHTGSNRSRRALQVHPLEAARAARSRQALQVHPLEAARAAGSHQAPAVHPMPVAVACAAWWAAPGGSGSREGTLEPQGWARVGRVAPQPAALQVLEVAHAPFERGAARSHSEAAPETGSRLAARAHSEAAAAAGSRLAPGNQLAMAAVACAAWRAAPGDLREPAALGASGVLEGQGWVGEEGVAQAAASPVTAGQAATVGCMERWAVKSGVSCLMWRAQQPPEPRISQDCQLVAPWSDCLSLSF